MQPIALQLPHLQTMKEISGDHHTTSFIPLPMELISPFLNRSLESTSGSLG